MADENRLSEIAVVYGGMEKGGLYAVTAAANAVAAKCGKLLAVQVRIEYPIKMEKARIYGMLKPIRAFCRERGIELAEEGISPSPVVSRVMTVAVVNGEKSGKTGSESKSVRPGQEILVTKWIGLGGTARLLWECGERLKNHFPLRFLKQTEEMESLIFAGEDAMIANQAGAELMIPVAEGGILAALWQLAKTAGRGFSVDMKALPIRQETVEICEYLELNPYQLTGAGSLLIVAKEGQNMAEYLRKRGIPAVCAGCLTEGQGKILHNGEEIRYLDRPAPDEILKIF